MGSTSERDYGDKMGIGQHRSSTGPAINSGQRTRHDPGVDVGPGLSGGERQNAVPGSKADSMVNTTHGAADTDPHGLRRRKA